MKPIKLIFNAFGPYPDKVEIDFKEFGEGGVFLITGSTGAGKTTIFDAISYALYGESSGKDRSVDRLRSDYAGETEETYVDFTFSHKGREYRVVRKPDQELLKKRIGTDDTKKTTKRPGTVDLYREPDAPISGVKNVNSAIIDILKIDYAQFKQISMIAQGEFREVLNDSSGKREEMMRRIFMTEKYQKMGRVFDERHKKAFGEFMDCMKSIQQYFGGVVCDAESAYYEEVKSINANFDSKNVDAVAAKIEVINKILEEDKDSLCALEETVKEKKAEAEEATKAYALVQADNKLFEELDKHVKKQEQLNLQKDSMTEKEKQLEKQKKAVYEVKPSYDRYIFAKTELEKAEKDCSQAATEQKEAKRKYEESKAAYDNALAKQEIAEENNRKVIILKNDESKYEERDRLNRERNRLQSLRQSIKLEQERMEKQLQELKGKLEKAVERMAVIENSPAEYVKVVAALEKLVEMKKRLEEVCVDKYKNLYELQKNRAAAQDRYLNIRQEYDNIKAEFDHLEKIFEASRAGIMAQHLAEGVPCPVCGSTHHPNPAKLSEETVSEESMKALKDKRDQKEKEKTDAHIAAETANEKYETEKKQLEETVVGLLGQLNNTLSNQLQNSSPEYIEQNADIWSEKEQLENGIAQLEKEIAFASELKVRFTSEKAELDRVRKDKSECEKLQEEWNVEKTANDKKLSETDNQISQMEGQLNSIKELPFASLQEALTEWEKLEAESNQIRKTIENATLFMNQADKEVAATTVKQTATAQAVEEKKEQCNHSLKDFETICKAQGFADENDFAVCNVGKAVIEATESKISAFKEEVARNHANVEAAKANVQGKERRDESEALQAYKECDVAYKKAMDAQAALKNTIENNKKILTAITSSKVKVDKAHYEANMLNNMQGLFRGQANHTNRISFEAFVQMSGFDGILAAANKRLYPISGGQYVLKRNGGKVSKSGDALALDVLDNYTGKTRPAKTLSGGESFMASLSLALGLSDKITASAGGVQVDTLFIDEGFGSLDEKALNDAIDMLQELSTGNKLIGIISHRPELKEAIPKKVMIEKTNRGSKLEVELEV